MCPSCPSKDELLAYTSGNVPEPRGEEIDHHILQCGPCQAELETWSNQEDTFLSRLREEDAEDEFAKESECVEVQARVAEIGKEPTFVQPAYSDGIEDSYGLGNIGPYRLLAKLGAGGMGTVYKAFHPKLKRLAALKMLPPERTQDQQAIQRFEREMEAVGKLDHPNIVRATDAGEYQDRHFLVMEYIEGIDLSELSKRHGPLPIANACELIRQAAVGLQHAHENRLVHRDIKPSNLMLTRDGNVKILDLGLALLPEQLDEGSELTSTGQAMGTLDYMAPEQGGDSHDVDIRADIYALGATLYKLLTGQAIFAGPNHRTVMDKWRALATEDPTPIQERRPEIPDDLAEVVHRMLARELDDRYAAPHEVAEALTPFCDGADLAALAVGREATTPDEVTQSTTSLLKEAASLDTSLRVEESADLAPTQSSVVKGKPAGASAGLSRSAQAKPQSAALRWKPSMLLIAGGAGLLGIVAVLAAMVFYFQTPKGTLRVAIDDPKIKVEIKGEDIVLTNADKKPIKLKAGGHTLIVTRGNDFKFETTQLILKKGETTTVKVEMLPDKVQVVGAAGVIGVHALERPSADNLALYLDGEDDYLRTPLGDADVSGPLTIEFMVDADMRLDEGFTWLATLDADKRIELNIHQEKGNRAIELFRRHGETAWQDFLPLEGELRGHVAVVWGGKQVKMFVNGKGTGQSHAHPLESPFTSNVKDPVLFLGARGLDMSNKFDHYLHGKVDGVRISSVARYQKDFVPPDFGNRFTLDKHTLALYHFDEGSGDVLHDSSGNGHHGKIVGAKWVRVKIDDTPVAATADEVASAPFNGDEAKQHQLLWADKLGMEVDFTNEIGMKFRIIPPGKFKMGSVQGDPNEKPVHDVTISKPFYIGVYEVLQEEYEAVMPVNPSKFVGERLPVEFVTSEEAAAYCAALSKKTGQTYRLPTEAEWEFACRAGTDTPWSFGDDPDDLPDYAWCKENGEGKTHSVGQKKPNAFGLYDMHGNVFEYCSDFTADYAGEAAVDPQGPTFGRYKGFRGGSWFFPLYHSRSANRQDKQWPARGTHVGFRVVLEIDNGTK